MRVWFNTTFSSLHAALRLIRQGDAEGRYTLLASSPNPHAPFRLSADEFHPEPTGLSSEDYVDWCAEFCAQQRVDIFVPGREARPLAAMHERFAAQGTRILSSGSAQALHTLHDKAAFCASVRQLSAPPAAWLPCSTLAEFDAAYASLSAAHPAVCIKPAVSVYGIGFRRIREDISTFDLFAGGHEYQINLEALRTMLGTQESFPTMLVMEYLGGHEFSVDCVADHGVLRVAVARRKPLSGTGQVIDERDDIQRTCQELVAQFGLNGYVNIQFREGDSGLRLLEINPRMSGGIAMACLAGPNLPYLGLRGFDQGYAGLSWPPIQTGIRVGEVHQAVVLP